MLVDVMIGSAESSNRASELSALSNTHAGCWDIAAYESALSDQVLISDKSEIVSVSTPDVLVGYYFQ